MTSSASRVPGRAPGRVRLGLPGSIRAVAGDFVLGVDLDGVCGDYTAAFRQVVASELDVAPEELPDDRSWDFAEWGLADPETFDRLHRAAVLEYRMFRDMPPVDGTADALWRLSDAGIWIRIITHRLYVNWGHAVAVADTVSWLDRVGIPYRDICFLGQKLEVEADVYVDDAPHNISELRRAGNTVIVFDQPYNRDLAEPRAGSWSEIEELVSSLAAQASAGVQHPLPGIHDGPDRLRRRVSGPSSAEPEVDGATS